MTTQVEKAAKETRTRLEVIVITAEKIRSWKVPPCQRPIRENAKVLALASRLKVNGGVLPGVITIGIVQHEEYIADGQHRAHSFMLSGLKEGFVAVRYRRYGSMAELSEDFVEGNGQLVTMAADDVLRGVESGSPGMQYIREKCPYVGYGGIGRSPGAPIVSMSKLLRAWHGTEGAPHYGGIKAADLAQRLEMQDAEQCVDFLKLAFKGWGRDPEYKQLYGALNMTLCMWLFRRCCLEEPEGRSLHFSKEQFGRCLGHLSTSPDYLEWLVGRTMRELDRSPAYGRIKALFRKKLSADGYTRPLMLDPEWAANSGSRSYQ